MLDLLVAFIFYKMEAEWWWWALFVLFELLAIIFAAPVKRKQD